MPWKIFQSNSILSDPRDIESMLLRELNREKTMIEGGGRY